ncbi:AI-2E family transporter [Methanogenium organophilum]|uniref:AI-2E family transporter n=1 Tax=Methanogenium organophilum TaxID=2199 RepID=A0A9X9T7M3_METOG|nr:AI-2E family transporter [Methanogenium organophilum]WAI00252.1 AI-2E family transporter [Methanogenium organophilum]
MNFEKKRRDWFVVGISVILILLITVMFRALLNPLIISGALATVLIPFHNSIKKHLPPAFSSFLITTGVVIFIVVMLMVSLSAVFANGEYIQEVVNSIFALLSIDGGVLGLDVNPVVFDLQSIINGIITAVQGSIGEILGATAYYSIIFMILFLFLYLFILYGERMFHEIWSLVPTESKPKISILNALISDSLYSLIIVHVGIALIVFFAALPFFMILGYGHVLFWSVICGIFALIPVFGPVVIIAFLAVYALSLGDYFGLALILVIGWPLLCAIPDWYLRPVLMGKRSKLNAVLIFIALFGGIAVMGVMGFLYGPLALAILTGVYRICVEEFGGKSSILQDTSP